MAIEKEINLASLIEVMWVRARGILLFTFGALVLAMLVSLTIQNRYSAMAKVIMNKSKLGERTMQNPAIPMNSYLILANSESLHQSLMKKYNLTDPPFNLIYPEDLQSRINLWLVQDTSMLRIEVELEDPQTAADVANDIANNLIEKSSEIIQLETTSSVAKIAGEVQQLREDVRSKKDIYEKLLLENNKQFIMNKLDTSNSILAKERSEIPNIKSAIAQMVAQVSKYNEVLSATDFQLIIETKKNVLDDPSFTETARSHMKNQDIAAFGEITIVDEELNEGYIVQRREADKLVVDLEGQRNMLTEKEERVAFLEEEVKKLEQTFNRMNLAEEIAKAEYDRTLEILGGVDKEYGWTATNVASERQDLYLIDAAVPPMKKSYPPRTLMVGIVGTIAFLLSFMYYLLRDLYGLMKEEKLSNKQGELF